jgi:hypothetical protein
MCNTQWQSKKASTLRVWCSFSKVCAVTNLVSRLGFFYKKHASEIWKKIDGASHFYARAYEGALFIVKLAFLED